MRVATVGSCLSRKTARYILSADVVNSVYHNRSDRLLEALVSSGTRLISHDDLCTLLNIGVAHRRDGREFSMGNILHNQSADGFGLHCLPAGAPFHETLASSRFDLILIDNFMDISARLYGVPDGDRYFCRYPKGKVPEGLVLGSRLTPQESAANFSRIVDVLRMAQPGAQIVFLHFPVNNYPAERQGWADAFLEALVLPEDVQVIRPRPVTPRYPDREPQHFQRWEYRRYAAQVMLLRARWWLERLWRKDKRRVLRSAY